MPDIWYLNGKFLALEDVRISPDDRGYQFGDGIYEVIRTYNGIPVFLDDHLNRLERSAQEIRLPLPFKKEELQNRVYEGVKLSGYQNGKVYIQITRGVAPREHQFPCSPRPTVLMTVREISELDEVMKDRGVAAITLPDWRWARCDIKSLNLLPNVLAKQQANERGVFEAIFLKDGLVTEGASSNVGLVRNGIVSTPLLNCDVLAGVTRKVVLDLAKTEGLEVQERSVKANELLEADELFLVGTTIEVLSVTKLDGKPIKNGMPGPVTTCLKTRFLEHISDKTRRSHS